MFTLRFVIMAITLSYFMVLGGCSTRQFADLYQPGATSIRLWPGEDIPLDPAWSFVGTVQVPVRGMILDSSLVVMDEIKTLIFTQNTDAGAAFLLCSRVDKTNPLEIFRYLGGDKVEIAGQPYREGFYGLESNATDPEYMRYFAVAQEHGLSVASQYHVRVLDRLPVDSTLVRVMEVFPGTARLSLPGYGRLYPQERQETWPRRIF